MPKSFHLSKLWAKCQNIWAEIFRHFITILMKYNYRRSQGVPKGPCSQKILENIVILCFERRFSEQNSVIRLKSNILAPNFWAGYATEYNLPCY